MKLLVQPGDGITTLLKGINGAKTSVEIMIFRLDRSEIERALASAVKRGVFVHALIANINRAGEAALRRLEMRLLAAGATVARTADDLTRYHGKVMIVDRKDLYLLAFNFTYLDIEHSRSFAIITSNPAMVREAVKLFEADTKRHPYEGGVTGFLVSPVNARAQLTQFLAGARKELLIYDPTVSDPAMLRLLDERAKAGVTVKILGRLTQKSSRIAAHKLPHMRLHTRTIVRDGSNVFIGSMSLREAELDERREVGLIVRDRTVASRIMKTFQEDWELAEQARQPTSIVEIAPEDLLAKKVAKAMSKQMPPVGPLLDEIIREMGGDQAEIDLSTREMEESVKDAVKAAVKEAVRDALVEATIPQHIAGT